jgi:agmatinase
MNKQILSFMACETPYSDSEVVLFGAPFDGTTSYRPGTRFGPMAMRTESYGVETYSPYLDLDMEDYKYADIGDIDMPFGSAVRALEMIEEKVQQILLDDKKPLMMGGEHLVTLGSVRALYKKYPNLKIIHLDAHADLREHYMDEKLSHATVMRRCYDLVGKHNIYQFGIRSGTREEFDFGKKHTFLNRFNLKSIDQYLLEFQDFPIYLTVDLDVLDPSVFPGTGTPEPGGVSFKELTNFLMSIQDVNLVGADVVELSPHYDPTGISQAAAVKTVREILLLMTKNK